jgi:hypothetical protein
VYRALASLPIPHDHGVPLFISQVAQCLDVLFDFELQGSRNHPARSLPGEFVQRFRDLWSLSFGVICGNLVHGVSFRRLLAVLGVWLPQGYATFFIPAIHNF